MISIAPNPRPSLLSCLIASVLLATGGGCGTEQLPGESELAREQRVVLTDPAGQEVDVVLLPGSSTTAEGDARYLVQAEDRTVELSKVSGPEGWTWLEVTVGDEVLGSMESSADYLSLTGPDGRVVRSTANVLPRSDVDQLVDPLTVTLMTGDNLERIDDVLLGDHGDRPWTMLARDTVLTCPGASCSNRVLPILETCCCSVGQKCVSTAYTCECKPATTAITGGNSPRVTVPTTARR